MEIRGRHRKNLLRLVCWCSLASLTACDPAGSPPALVSVSKPEIENRPKPRLLTDVVPAEFKKADLMDPVIPAWKATQARSRGRSAQSEKPLVDMAKTRRLWESLVFEEVGETGDVQLAENGLLIHPGSSLPTRVDFDVRGKFDRVVLSAWINPLPPDALSNKHAGTTGVRVLLDGRSLPWTAVDRRTNQTIELDLSQVGELSIVVDNYDNIPAWDWCIVGLQ